MSSLRGHSYSQLYAQPGGCSPLVQWSCRQLRPLDRHPFFFYLLMQVEQSSITTALLLPHDRHLPTHSLNSQKQWLKSSSSGEHMCTLSFVVAPHTSPTSGRQRESIFLLRPPPHCHPYHFFFLSHFFVCGSCVRVCACFSSHHLRRSLGRSRGAVLLSTRARTDVTAVFTPPPTSSPPCHSSRSVYLTSCNIKKLDVKVSAETRTTKKKKKPSVGEIFFYFLVPPGSACVACVRLCVRVTCHVTERSHIDDVFV